MWTHVHTDYQTLKRKPLLEDSDRKNGKIRTLTNRITPVTNRITPVSLQYSQVNC